MITPSTTHGANAVARMSVEEVAGTQGSFEHEIDEVDISGSPGFFSRIRGSMDDLKTKMFGEDEAARKGTEWASEETHTEATKCASSECNSASASTGEAGTKAAPATIGGGAAGVLVKQGTKRSSNTTMT